MAPDGSVLISARLVDAVGQGSAGTSQQMVDDMALAFDELKIQFKRQARGEVVAIAHVGPAQAARRVDGARGAQRHLRRAARAAVPRGARRRRRHLEDDDADPVDGDFEGEVHYDYTYARKDGGVAVIGCEGRFEGKRPQGTAMQKLSGKSSAEYRFDVAAGRALGVEVDQMTQVEGAIAGQQALQLGVRQHIRVEWTLDANEAKTAAVGGAAMQRRIVRRGTSRPRASSPTGCRASSPASSAPASAPPSDITVAVDLEGEGGGQWVLDVRGGSLSVRARRRQPGPAPMVSLWQSVQDWRALAVGEDGANVDLAPPQASRARRALRRSGSRGRS